MVRIALRLQTSRIQGYGTRIPVSFRRLKEFVTVEEYAERYQPDSRAVDVRIVVFGSSGFRNAATNSARRKLFDHEDPS